MTVTFEEEVFVPSRIRQFYSEKTIFITGTTGLVGRLVLEKLLRSCTDIKKIYLLIREKQGKTPEKRLEELLDDVIFKHVEKVMPKFKKKVACIKGDVEYENLGISCEDAQKLIEEVNCVFHCAANLRLDAKLRTAAYANVRSTKEMLTLAKKMLKLQAYIHVSTAYSNCPNQEIKEMVYKPPINEKQLFTLLDTFDDEFLDKVTPSLIGDWQNTYLYSKCIAEDLVAKEGKGLPIGIVRPSIIVSTYKQPIGGWINNTYGPIGFSVAIALGIMHILQAKSKCIIDLIPADYVSNNIISTAWDVSSKTPTDGNDKIQVYNCVSSPQNPITLGQFFKSAEQHTTHIPTTFCVWYYFFFMVSSARLFLIGEFLLHTLPAYIVDFIAISIGKQPVLVKVYTKIARFSRIIAYFTTREWKIHNENAMALWEKMNSEDKRAYPFNTALFKWNDYMYNYTRGGRLYILKEPNETVPTGQRKMFVLQMLHYSMVGLLLCGIYKLSLMAWSFLAGI